MVFSPKYMSKMKVLAKVPHVNLFCNEEPDVLALTNDRYKITRLWVVNWQHSYFLGTYRSTSPFGLVQLSIDNTNVVNWQHSSVLALSMDLCQLKKLKQTGPLSIDKYLIYTSGKHLE